MTKSKLHSLPVKCKVKGIKEKGLKMRRRTKKEEDGEVEAILEAAEAMMLLQLTTDSHLTRGGSDSDSLTADLSRRFNALKASPSTNPAPSRAPTRPDAGAKAIPDEEMKRVLGDDLSARFAALKASSSSSAGDASGLDLRKRGEDDGSDDGDVDEEGVSKKEVEKLVQWARDAARLDPSPPSDDDDEDGKQFDVKEYGTSDSDDELRRKKSNGKDLEKKKKKTLWF